MGDAGARSAFVRDQLVDFRIGRVPALDRGRIRASRLVLLLCLASASAQMLQRIRVDHSSASASAGRASARRGQCVGKGGRSGCFQKREEDVPVLSLVDVGRVRAQKLVQSVGDLLRQAVQSSRAQKLKQALPHFPLPTTYLPNGRLQKHLP